MNTMRTNLVLVLVGFLVLGFTGVSFGQVDLFEKEEVRTIKGPKWAPGEIIVKFKRGVSQDVIRLINQHHGTSTLSISKRGEFRRLRIPENRAVEDMVAIYSRNPNVQYAEPNYIVHAFMVPNDEFYHYQWHLDNDVYGGINMESAWDIQTGNMDVIVAVIDTGVAYEDNGRYKQAPDLANTSFVAGYDFVNNDTHPNDDDSHGTHVAGTVAQSTNNDTLGVAGVAFNTSIMPVKVLDRNGSGTVANVAKGIYFAADNGAAVINLSLGGASASTTLENAVADAYENGVTIVCASGNDGSEDTVSYPAAYDDYCIAVGATRYDEAVAYYSNGGLSLDLTAPGGDLTVDQNGDGYGDGVLQQTFNPNSKRPGDFGYWFFHGTSMAAPHVAGVAALLIANGITGPDNVRAALESTAEDKGPTGWDEVYGWGIVDASAALNYSPKLVHDVAVTDIGAQSWCIKGDLVLVDVTVANQGDFDETFTVTLTDTTDGGTIGSESVPLNAGDSSIVSFQWDTTDESISIGDHILLAEAETVTGETDTADNTMTTTVTIKEESVHDVAVTAIDAPSEAYQGDWVSVSVTVENQGTYTETTTVTLTDTTDGVTIGSKEVSLSAGDSTVVSFQWDTTGASVAEHILEAEASVVGGETDSDDNSMTTTVTIKESTGATMHVASIDMALKTTGINTSALATVTIVDAGNSPVEGATVYGTWSDATSDTDSGITDVNGQVTVESDKVKRAASGTTFTFGVDDVTKPGWTYNFVEASGSITVP